jgi:hypothetical protein
MNEINDICHKTKNKTHNTFDSADINQYDNTNLNFENNIYNYINKNAKSDDSNKITVSSSE